MLRRQESLMEGQIRIVNVLHIVVLQSYHVKAADSAEAKLHDPRLPLTVKDHMQDEFFRWDMGIHGPLFIHKTPALIANRVDATVMETSISS